LTGLALDANGLGAGCAAALAAAPAFAGLAFLSLGDNGLGARGAAALASAPLTNLQELQFWAKPSATKAPAFSALPRASPNCGPWACRATASARRGSPSWSAPTGPP
jgi:hypothetical protein